MINFIYTEGIFGIIAEVVLSLRDVPDASFPHLFYFTSDDAAFAFIKKSVKKKDAQVIPNVIRFLDESHMNYMNELMHSRKFKKNAGIFFEFSIVDDDKKFSKAISSMGVLDEAPRYAASYL